MDSHGDHKAKVHLDVASPQKLAQQAQQVQQVQHTDLFAAFGQLSQRLFGDFGNAERAAPAAPTVETVAEDDDEAPGATEEERVPEPAESVSTDDGLTSQPVAPNEDGSAFPASPDAGTAAAATTGQHSYVFEAPGSLGLNLEIRKSSGGLLGAKERLLVKSVEPGGAGALAGVPVDAEVTGVNGTPMGPTQLWDRLAQAAANSERPLIIDMYLSAPRKKRFF